MRYPIALAVVAAFAAAPAAAELTASSDTGFVSHHEAFVDVSAPEVWAEMVRPANWWNGAHSYSGDAANLTIDATAGGCFCETVPDGERTEAKSVEHMRVVHVAPNRILRLIGGLGPLQAEAVTGVLTMTIEPSGRGSKVTWDYVVGGYMRTPMSGLAPLVDQVIGEQFTRLAARFPAR